MLGGRSFSVDYGLKDPTDPLRQKIGETINLSDGGVGQYQVINGMIVVVRVMSAGCRQNCLPPAKSYGKKVSQHLFN